MEHSLCSFLCVCVCLRREEHEIFRPFCVCDAHLHFLHSMPLTPARGRGREKESSSIQKEWKKKKGRSFPPFSFQHISWFASWSLQTETDGAGGEGKQARSGGRGGRGAAFPRHGCGGHWCGGAVLGCNFISG
jgi:hypothetical protein